MTDFEKEQLCLLAGEIGKMAKELRSIKKWLLEIKDRKIEPQKDCGTCRFDDRYGDESICSTCARYYSDSYQPKDEPQTERSE